MFAVAGGNVLAREFCRTVQLPAEISSDGPPTPPGSGTKPVKQQLKFQGDSGRWWYRSKSLAPSNGGRLTFCPGGLGCLWWYEISFKVPEERLRYRVRSPLCPSIHLPVRQFVLFLCYSEDLFSIWIPTWPLSCLSPPSIAAFIPHPLVFLSPPTVCSRCRPCRLFSLCGLFSLWPLVVFSSLLLSWSLPQQWIPSLWHSVILFQGCDTQRIPDNSKSLGHHGHCYPGIPSVFLSSVFFAPLYHCLFVCVLLFWTFLFFKVFFFLHYTH